MKNLSIQEQKQIVGGGYYYKIFNIQTGEFMYKSKYYFDDEEQACIDDCMSHVNSYGWDYCGCVYNNETGAITFRW